MAESEIQAAQGLEDWPTTMAWLSPDDGPKPAPRTVNMVPPLPGPLMTMPEALVRFTTGLANRTDGPPALSTFQRITLTSTAFPLPALLTQVIDVSDVHVLCEHAVRPSTTTPSAAGAFPKFRPYTVSRSPPSVLIFAPENSVTTGAS